MEAVVIHETGGPEVLRLEEIEQPQPSEGEVLIALRAASVNPIDVKRRRDFADSFPVVLGYDLSGVVAESRAEEFSAGHEVFGRGTSGTYAQLATAHAGGLARKPAGLTHEQAAAIQIGRAHV